MIGQTVHLASVTEQAAVFYSSAQYAELWGGGGGVDVGKLN